jgi:hypothetical protein
VSGVGRRISNYLFRRFENRYEMFSQCIVAFFHCFIALQRLFVDKVYRVIQEKMVVSVISEDVSNSEWLMVTESAVLTPLDLCLWGLDEGRSLQTEGGYRRRIADLHFVCCCPHEET